MHLPNTYHFIYFVTTATPLKVLLAAAIVNFFGDMLFVGCKHPMIGGAAGAAWATVFSQYAALGLFIKWLTKKPTTDKKTPKVVDLTKNILEFMGKPTKKNNEAVQSQEMELEQQMTKESSRKKNGLLGIVEIQS